MKDRRHPQIRSHTVTLGAVIAVMGSYAFSPFDTQFTQILARLEIETLWGVIMILSGALLGCSATTQERYVRWGGNVAGMISCGWTVAMSYTGGILTPTVAACGVICAGCALTMMRDALSGQKYRCMLKRTGQWES